MIRTNSDIVQAEADEILGALETALLVLEKSPRDRNLAARVHGLFHSLNILCSLSGLEQVQTLVVSALNYFDALRRGEAEYAAEMTEFALSTRDYIQDALHAADQGDGGILDRLNNTKAAWETINQKMIMPAAPDGGSAADAGDGAKVADRTEEVSLAPGMAPERPADRPDVVAKKSAILIIDDEMINRVLLMEIVKDAAPGAEIVTVDNAVEGLFHYFTRHFDLVFLDIMMPDFDGDDFIAAIKKIRKKGLMTGRANIVVQTAIESMEQLMSYVRQECIAEVIRKPITPARIREMIETYCP